MTNQPLQPNRITPGPPLPGAPAKPFFQKFAGGGGAGRETKEERETKQRAINRQSARRDAIDYLVAQGKPFTLDQVYTTAEALFQWVERKS